MESHEDAGCGDRTWVTVVTNAAVYREYQAAPPPAPGRILLDPGLVNQVILSRLGPTQRLFSTPGRILLK